MSVLDGLWVGNVRRGCLRGAATVRRPSVNSSSESFSRPSSSSLADMLSSVSVINRDVLLICLWWCVWRTAAQRRVDVMSDEPGGDNSTTRRRFDVSTLTSESPS